MAFVITTVSYGMAERRFARSSRVEGDRLAVGRSPENGMQLTDLAVALHHFTIDRAGGRLELRVEAGLSVQLDGHKATSGIIELPAGGDILIASHLLRFMPTSPDAADIPVEVERVTDSEFKLDKTAERLFTLAPVLPGKRALSWLFSLLVLGLFLAWPIKASWDRHQRAEKFARFHADEMWSSGSLSQAHAALSNNCTACHVKPFEAVRDTACKTCHTSVHDHADPFRLARARPDLGRWRRVELAFKEKFDLPPGRCVECHKEHEGPQQMPATAQRFCADCHGDLRRKLSDTHLANAGDFGRSHPDFSPVLIAGWNGDRPILRRLSLAQRPREDSGLKFPHDLHLSKTSGVAQMARRLGARYGFGRSLACKDCHDPAPDGARFQPVDMEQDCAMCHDLAFDRSGGITRTLRHGDPAQAVAELRDFYRGRGAALPSVLVPAARRRPGDAPDLRNRIQFARGPGSAEQAIRRIFSPGGACFDCHRVDAPPPGSLDFRIRPVAFPTRYLRKGWFDHRAHATQSCTSCHGAERSSAAFDLLIPGVASCRTCHGGEGSSKPVPSSCAMCHDYHMDAGAPSMTIRRKVRGKKRDWVVAEARR
jgi:predicted CXXCH cytochrome family protein